MIQKYAHFGLAFLGMAIGTPIVLSLFPNPFALISLTLLITTLAFWYEWHEFVDPLMSEIYGSLEHFVEDSKMDVKQDLVGIFVGGWVGAIVYGVLQYV